MIYRKTIYN